MSLSIDQIREIIVGEAVATETTLATFQATASPLEIAVVSADGTAPGVGKPFIVVTKAGDGTVIKSDIVYPKSVTRLDGIAYRAEVPKVVTVSAIAVPATTGDKQEYMVDLRMFNVGSLSVENFHIFHGHTLFTKTASNNAEAVVDALIANLNQNFSKVSGATSTTNPYFTFSKTGTGAGAALVITAKTQDYEAGKKFARPLEFDVAFKSDLASTVTITNPGFPGVGTGKKVAEMEWFLRGFRGDSYRGVGYPFTWPSGTKSLSDVAGTYNTIELIHIPKGDGLNVIQARKELTIAIEEASGTVSMDALIADINIFLLEPAVV